MDPNYGGGLDEQNWQFSVEDFESLYQQPQIPDSCDPFDSLNGSHFESGDLGSQSVARTELPGFPQGPILGYDPDLSECLDPAGINQDNQAIAGRSQPDLPQGSFENFDELNCLNGFQFGEFGNQAMEQLDAPQVQSEIPRTARNAYDLYEVNEEPVELGRARGRSNCGLEGEDLLMGIVNVNGIQPQISHPHVGQPADSQAAARGQDQRAQKLQRKREVDRAYRERKKAKQEELEVENQRLQAEVKALSGQNYHLATMISRLRGDNHPVNNQLETLSKKLDWVQAGLEFINQPTTQCSGVTGVVNQQQMSILQPLLTEMKQLLAGFQNITQRSGAHVYAQPWQPQHNISISQVSQAATTTLPLTQPDGTSRMQQKLQSPETSHGLPDTLPLEQLAQTAHAQTKDVSLMFSLLQGQGRNTAFEGLQYMWLLSDQDAELGEFFSSFFRPKVIQCSSKKRGNRVVAASLVAENGPLKPEIQEKQELCHEDQRMKSNIEAFEAEKCRLKLEIGEKKQPMKSNLEAIEAENEKLKREIDVKRKLMQSNLKAFEAQIRQLVDEFKSLNVSQCLSEYKDANSVRGS